MPTDWKERVAALTLLGLTINAASATFIWRERPGYLPWFHLDWSWTFRR
jgi:hypothetical protein